MAQERMLCRYYRPGSTERSSSWKVASFFLLIGIALAPRLIWAQSGKEDYEKYCADCHSSNGKGNGPRTQVLPMYPTPPDLTKLALANGGKFPFDEVVSIIDGRTDVPSHEHVQMPFFGTTLQRPGKEYTRESDAEVRRRIEAMARYVESLQQR
jgi:mono/diheme cytochrome c family protein